MLNDDALWDEFGAEGEEHLDNVERLLASPPDAAGIASLFRAFHSLKGMSAALGAAGMARIAHRCEDLLGLARQGRLAMTPPLIQGLLAAVDALRELRATVLRTRADAPPPAGILRQLEALADTPPSFPPPEAAGRAPVAPSPALPRAAPLAVLLRHEAEALVATALAMAGPSPEALALAEEAGRAGLPRLASQLSRAGLEDALPWLGQLRRLLDVLEAITGADAGSAALSAAAAEAGAAMLGPRLAALAARLIDAPLADSIATDACEAARMAAALGHGALEEWLLLAQDLAARAPSDSEAATRLAEMAPVLAAHLGRCAREGTVALLALPAVELPEAQPAGTLPEELARLLSAADHRHIEKALGAGRNLYRARLGVPSSAEEEAAVQAWLEAQQAETLTSRTLLDTVPPTLDMLFLAPAEPDAMAAARAAFDPAGRLVLAMSPLRAAASASAGETSGPLPTANLRVRQEAVDGVITLEAELHGAILALDGLLGKEDSEDLPGTLAALARRAGGSVGQELSALAVRLGHARAPKEQARAQLSLALRRLDEAVMELRVVPIGTLFARLPRIVRSVALEAAQGVPKDVALEMEGQDVRIDRALIEMLADPLLHLVRNAVDHGVETPEARIAAGKPPRATLRVRAERRTGQVRVEVSDDGRGIDREAVLRAARARRLVTEEEAAAMDDHAARRLLFRPGFSTRERVSETSGRGVGLDVVQDAVRRAGGTLDLTSTPAQGTTFVLNLPLSAAMAAVLLVEVAGYTYALPTARVEAVLPPGEHALPLAHLLGLEAGPAGATVLLRQTAGGQVALAVDAVRQRTELLLRPLPPALAILPAIGGAGVLGNGELVVILEPDGISMPDDAEGQAA